MISYGHYTETSKTKASRPKENIESNIFEIDIGRKREGTESILEDA